MPIFWLVGTGAAQASASYSMSYMANVASGTSNNTIGSLEISLDKATASLMSNDFVILSLPSSPAGYGLRIASSGPSVYGAVYNISVSQVSQASIKLSVQSLVPNIDTVTIWLPLVIDIPGGVNGNVQLAIQAPPGSLFSSNSGIQVAGFGIGIIRVAPNAINFPSTMVGSSSAAKTVSISNAGFSDITIQDITITGADLDDFQLQNSTDGEIIAPGESGLTAGVIFNPSSTGAKQAILNITSDDPYTPVYQIALTGDALPATGQTQSAPVNAGLSGFSVFQIGQTSFTVNGTMMSMDAAPYIKDGRTFLPLRYVADALGVQDSNIVYYPASREVTVVRGGPGGMTVQFTIGSTTMLVNGSVITMDAAPEINNGRTYLPATWLAKALGAGFSWNPTAQTVAFQSY
jgi:hypothetical protein